MKKRALVLGGGGTVGIAWEAGVLAGLAQRGVDLAAADLLVGTSAGSVVGALLAMGLPPGQLLAVQQAMAAADQGDSAPLDPEGFQTIYTKWFGAPEVTPGLRREIGALALKARVADEQPWTARFHAMVGAQGVWPERRLYITGVEAATGEFVAWDSSSGVPLHLAVASSCSVPAWAMRCTAWGTGSCWPRPTCCGAPEAG